MKLIETIENKINSSKFAEILLKQIGGLKKKKSKKENGAWRRPNPNIPNGTQSKSYKAKAYTLIEYF